MARHFWKDFATGATFGAAGTLGVCAMSLLCRRTGRVIRIEKSLQIGRPVNEVFGAWADLSRMPQYCKMIDMVWRIGDRSHWVVTVDGQSFEWDAEVVRIVPNQAIGWKSVKGPKHTGRMSFSPIGNDTLLHVQMNYAPPLHFSHGTLATIREKLESCVDQAFRNFKAAMEAEVREFAAEHQRTGQPIPSKGQARETGTDGPEQSSGRNLRYGNPSPPV